jgi:hypothetical protein
MKHTLLIFGLISLYSINAQPIIIDRNCAKLEPIPESAIVNAKQSLHIAYAHTSHGSQLTDGMSGLIGQTNLIGYKGDIYEWNEGGTEGALDIDDCFVDGDLGHSGSTQWAVDTRIYLDNPDNNDVNVIIWSWCGGCSDNTYEGIQTYLDTMNQLEVEYPNVKFVYMTGHTDIWADATLKANNQHIREYCIANNKILYDFEDIERYNPDGNYFEFATDNCDYYSDATGSNFLGNWATEWQNSHTEGIYWYTCSAAHTEPLNGNLKAYAAWHLWCRLAGWEGTSIIEKYNNTDITIYPNPLSQKGIIKFNIVQADDIKIEIIDLTGKQFKQMEFKNTEIGINTFEINLSNLPDGLYILKWNAGFKTGIYKFIHIR